MSFGGKLTSLLITAMTISLGGCYDKYVATSSELRACKYCGSDEEIVEQVFVENCGWYLFVCLPICCGDMDEEAILPWTFFNDQCTDEAITRKFNEHVSKQGLKAVGVTMHSTDTLTLDVPGLMIPIVVPYVFTIRDRQISGVLVRPKGKVER